MLNLKVCRRFKLMSGMLDFDFMCKRTLPPINQKLIWYIVPRYRTSVWTCRAKVRSHPLRPWFSLSLATCQNGVDFWMPSTPLYAHLILLTWYMSIEATTTILDCKMLHTLRPSVSSVLSCLLYPAKCPSSWSRLQVKFYWGTEEATCFDICAQTWTRWRQ